ncbi:MAG: YebC/PmpR family DNA-binding transcriptional regulator, partial [Janthinobacterium lividum]
TPEGILETAIEARAEDVISDQEYHLIYSAIENFTECLEFMTTRYGSPEDSHIGWKPHNTFVIDDFERAEKLLKLVDSLEESDDVQRVFGNYELSDRVYEKLFRA